MPIRRKDAQGRLRRLLVVGGSADYPRGLFHDQRRRPHGAGLVTCTAPRRLYPIVAPKFMEAMPRRMPQDKAGRFSPAALPALLTLQGVSQATVIGPLGRSDALTELVGVFARRTVPGGRRRGRYSRSRRICCGDLRVRRPHTARREFARMAGGNPPPVGGIERLRPLGVCQIYRCVLVLKGHRVTAAPDGRVIVNTSATWHGEGRFG